MHIDDAEFEERLTAALYRAAELDYEDVPSDEELDQIVHPSPRFQRRMKALLRNPSKYLRNQRRPVYLRALRTAAAVLIAFTVLLGATMAASPTVRAEVIKFVRSWFEDRTAYETPQNIGGSELTFGYIPEGFELIMLQEDEMGGLRIYQNDDSVAISIFVSRGKQIVDNEHSVFYQTTINGRIADIYESNDPQYPNIIVIYEDHSGAIITIVSEINLGELIKIGENIN